VSDGVAEDSEIERRQADSWGRFQKFTGFKVSKFHRLRAKARAGDKIQNKVKDPTLTEKRG